MKFPIYLDYSATTPVDPRVVDKMIPFLYENFGQRCQHEPRVRAGKPKRLLKTPALKWQH